MHLSLEGAYFHKISGSIVLPPVGNIDILLQNTMPGTSSLETFINKISQCNYTGQQENTSSKLTRKLVKVWATDSKSVFSFSPAHMVFEMRHGLFSCENWIENFSLFT
jgi:hypothetical protein